jgi:hypothetical protein
MRRLIVVAVAALCVMGTSSLALAEEGARYGDQMEPTGKLSQEPSVLGNKREPVRSNEPMKGKKTEHKEKTKAHKDAAKAAPAAPAPAP